MGAELEVGKAITAGAQSVAISNSLKLSYQDAWSGVDLCADGWVKNGALQSKYSSCFV